jgi:magnesium chelatase family protein
MHQSMEDKVVTISRAKGSLTFSANFQLIAAMNPCPCGYYGDLQKPCTCAQGLVTKYQKRISGPLLDRIDIHIEVSRVDYEKLSGNALVNRASRFESAYKLHGIYKAGVFRQMILQISSATPTCALQKSGSIANCRMRVKT